MLSMDLLFHIEFVSCVRIYRYSVPCSVIIAIISTYQWFSIGYQKGNPFNILPFFLEIQKNIIEIIFSAIKSTVHNLSCHITKN